MADWSRLQKSAAYYSLKDVLEYFKRSEAALWTVANNLTQENLADELIDRIYETREEYIRQLNKWEPDTLIGVSERLGLWVLQNYPNREVEPESEWDQLILSSYFQLTGFLGIAPVREE